MAEKAEPEEDKKPRVYKGEMVKVKDLEANNIVQPMPEFRKEKKLPLFMVIDKVEPWDAGTQYLHYLDPRDGFKKKFITLKKKDEVNLLTGRMAADLAVELREHKTKNLHLFVAAPPMSLGTDPEVFVTVKDKDSETIIPAFEFLPSKKKPLNLSARGYNPYPGTAVYWDGFQAEFTTDSTTCLAYQTDAIQRSMKLLHGAVKGYNKEKKAKAALSISSVLQVPDGYLETAKDEHVEFGCMPSLNVYGMAGDGTPGRQVPIRFAGGHLHLGVGKLSKAQIAAAIKGLDRVLGVACVSLFEGYDVAARRRYYGLAGEYRTPTHGLEYRTLSNAWLIHPVITNVVFEVARCAIGFGLSDMAEMWNSPEEETIEAINNNDVDLARKILDRNKGAFTSIVNQRGLYNSADRVFHLFRESMESRLKHPRDMAANWRLDVDHWANHGGGDGLNWATARDNKLFG